jgi:hypothetical protein
MLQRHLEEAERHVAQGERHISEQEERVAELARLAADVSAQTLQEAWLDRIQARRDPHSGCKPHARGSLRVLSGGQ